MPKRKDGRRQDGNRRRSKGEGSYWFDAKSGRHFYRLIHDGVRHTIADAEPERAKARFEELKAKLAKHVNVVAGRKLLNEWATYYLHDVIRSDVSPSTQRTYLQRYSYHIGPTLGSYRLDELTPPLILAWRNAINKAFELSSVRQALSLLDRMLDHALVEGAIGSNPAAQIRPPRHSAKPKDDDEQPDDIGIALTDRQVDLLLEAARTKPLRRVRASAGETTQRVGAWMELHCLYLLAVSLGLRKGEALGLRVEDIDIDRRRLTVAQQVQYLGGPLQLNKPKSETSRRTVPLTDELVAAVRDQLVRSGRRKGLLFTTRAGQPINPSNLLRHFHRLVDRVNEAELDAAAREGRTSEPPLPPSLRFHDLRVTAVSRWRRQGARFDVIASIVGHASPQVTADEYAKVGEAEQRRVLEGTGT
jgi:integrase